MSSWPNASTAALDERLGHAVLRQVAAEDRGLAADLRGRLLGELGVEVADQHARAVLGEQLGRRAADPAGRARDDRGLPVQHTHAHPPRFPVESGYLIVSASGSPPGGLCALDVRSSRT